MAWDRGSLLGQGLQWGGETSLKLSVTPGTGPALSTKKSRRDSEPDTLEVHSRELKVLLTVLNSPPFLQHSEYFPFPPFPLISKHQ